MCSKRHVERCRGVDPTSRGGAKMEGDAIDKDLALFDIGTDCHTGGTQQRKPQGKDRCENMGSREESSGRGVWTPKDDQVAIGCPPCGRDLDVGKSRLGSKCL